MTLALGRRGTNATGAGSRAAKLLGAAPVGFVRFMERWVAQTKGDAQRGKLKCNACLRDVVCHQIHTGLRVQRLTAMRSKAFLSERNGLETVRLLT